MIDIHTHILHGIDDGPRELDGAVALARAEVADGVTVLAATPHALGAYLDASPPDRDEALVALRAELARLGLPLRIVPGSECLVVERLADILTSQPEYLYGSVSDEMTTMHHRHVLIELSEDMPVPCLDTMLFRLQMLRITPVLAHPERHPDVRRNVTAIEGFVRHGGKLQITAASLLGEAGWRERRVCEALLRRGLATVLATDAHSAADAGSLGRALARATKLLGSVADDLVHAAPAAILGLA